MALRDWLTGKDHYKEVPATSPSVATVAEEEHHILQPLPQEISGIESTVATVAADNEERTKKCNNNDSSLEQYTLSFRTSCTPATLATLATLQCHGGLWRRFQNPHLLHLLHFLAYKQIAPAAKHNVPFAYFSLLLFGQLFAVLHKPSQFQMIKLNKLVTSRHLPMSEFV